MEQSTEVVWVALGFGRWIHVGKTPPILGGTHLYVAEGTRLSKAWDTLRVLKWRGAVKGLEIVALHCARMQTFVCSWWITKCKLVYTHYLQFHTPQIQGLITFYLYFWDRHITSSENLFIYIYYLYVYFHVPISSLKRGAAWYGSQCITSLIHQPAGNPITEDMST